MLEYETNGEHIERIFGYSNFSLLLNNQLALFQPNLLLTNFKRCSHSNAPKTVYTACCHIGAHFHDAHNQSRHSNYATRLRSGNDNFLLPLLFLKWLQYLPFLIAHLYSEQVIEEFNDEPARFGASFPINGLRAFAVMANPSNSCQPIEQPPPVNSTKVPRYVVIITRLIFQSRKFTEVGFD